MVRSLPSSHKVPGSIPGFAKIWLFNNNNNNNNNKYLYSAYPRALSALQINTGFNSLRVLESPLERLTCYGANWQLIRSALS